MNDKSDKVLCNTCKTYKNKSQMRGNYVCKDCARIRAGMRHRSRQMDNLILDKIIDIKKYDIEFMDLIEQIRQYYLKETGFDKY